MLRIFRNVYSLLKTVHRSCTSWTNKSKHLVSGFCLFLYILYLTCSLSDILVIDAAITVSIKHAILMTANHLVLAVGYSKILKLSQYYCKRVPESVHCSTSAYSLVCASAVDMFLFSAYRHISQLCDVRCRVDVCKCVWRITFCGNQFSICGARLCWVNCKNKTVL